MGSGVGLYLLFSRQPAGPAYPYGLPATLTAHFADGTSKTAPLIDAQEAAYLWRACSVSGLSAMYDFGSGEEVAASISGPDGKTIIGYSSAYETGLGLGPPLNNFALDHLYIWLDLNLEGTYAYPVDFPLDLTGFTWCTAPPPGPPDWIFWAEAGTLFVVGALGVYVAVTGVPDERQKTE